MDEKITTDEERNGLAEKEAGVRVVDIPVGSIRPNPHQPRTAFDEGEMRELADSIREHGVVQPLIVTTNGHVGGDSRIALTRNAPMRIEPDEGRPYVLIAGERRWRASMMAGLATVPCIVREHVDEATMALDAAIENLHRADLNVIEEARMYRHLMDLLGLKVGDVARQCGKHPTVVGHRLEWLKLEPEIQDLAARGKLPKDARVVEALLSVPAGARVKLAARLAYDGVRIKTIQSACARLVTHLKATARDDHAVERATRERSDPEAQARVGWDAVREAARETCEACEIHATMLRGQVAEPAWEMIAHASRETCKACNVREVYGACEGCPTVELLRRVMVRMQDAGGKRQDEERKTKSAGTG
jgi:ParB family chromosome partitioning protein